MSKTDRGDAEREERKRVWLPLVHIGQACVCVRNPAGRLRVSHWKVCERREGKPLSLWEERLMSQLEGNVFPRLLPLGVATGLHVTLCCTETYISILFCLESSMFGFSWTWDRSRHCTHASLHTCVHTCGRQNLSKRLHTAVYSLTHLEQYTNPAQSLYLSSVISQRR